MSNKPLKNSFLKIAGLTGLLIMYCNILYIDNKSMHNQALAQTWQIEEKDITPFAELLANPEKYHNGKITTEGYLNLAEGKQILYKSADACDHNLSRESFWVDFDSNDLMLPPGKRLVDFEAKYVRITGQFNMNTHGQNGLCSGSLSCISQIAEKPTAKIKEAALTK